MTDAVSQLGEFGLIARIRDRIEATGATGFLGDDAALVRVGTTELLYTTDVMVEEVDFELEWCSGDDLGWKALALSVSDIAAMGGRPLFAVSTLALPPGSPLALVDGIIEGLLRGAARWDVQLVGGDLSRASRISLSVAVLGQPGDRAVFRSGARVGDAICVTGALGGAAAGLRLIQSGPATGGHASHLMERLLRPQPRVSEGQILAALGASAMIDVSDGLLADLQHLLDASGVGCEVWSDAIPVDPAFAHEVGVLEGRDPLTLAQTGGEDLELLFTLQPDAVVGARATLEKETGTTITEIGRITEGDALLDGQLLTKGAGWDHLRIP